MKRSPMCRVYIYTHTVTVQCSAGKKLERVFIDAGGTMHLAESAA